MKKYILNSLMAILTISSISCSTDSEEQLSGHNDLVIEFDNGFNGNDLLLNTSGYESINQEQLKISRLNYIVSNFKLTTATGTVFTYSKNDSYFIINEETGHTQVVLTEVPAGEYASISFGIGVDQEKYLRGAEGQGDFLSLAEANEMMWAWQAGYKFLNYEGSFTTATTAEAQNFKVHMGSHGSSLDNYRALSLALPSSALVSSELKPVIHLAVDASKILNGQYQLSLEEKSVIMVDENKSPQIAENLTGMFRVDHVHNGASGTH